MKLKHFKSLPLLLVAFLVVSCASRPLVYDEMNDEEKADETKLQANIELTAKTLADVGFRFLDKEEQTTNADKVGAILDKVQSAMATETNQDLIYEVLDAVTDFSPDIRETAKDAFDLFNGWINIPNLSDVIPEVIRDRLAAFVRGALAGLSSYRSP